MKNETNPLCEENISKINDQIKDLLETHGEMITDAINDSDDKGLAVIFNVDIDCSESAPQIEIKCKFTPCTVTDKRSIQCSDPNQTELAFMEEGAQLVSDLKNLGPLDDGNIDKYAERIVETVIPKKRGGKKQKSVSTV